MLQVASDAAVVAESSDKGITYHGYGRAEEDACGPIDYIFTTKGTSVATFKIIRNTAKDMYPSDHYPIVADVLMEVE